MTEMWESNPVYALEVRRFVPLSYISDKIDVRYDPDLIGLTVTAKSILLEW